MRRHYLRPKFNYKGLEIPSKFHEDGFYSVKYVVGTGAL